MNKARYVLVVVAFTLTALLYLDRIAISVASEDVISAFQLTDKQFGWVLSIFALGYALFQAPSGAMADKWGPRKMLAIFVIGWSIFTFLTGFAWGFVSLLVIRFLFGMTEAGAFPTFARAIYSWLPAGERALAQGINLSGSRLGAAFALPFVAWLVNASGWRESFIILCIAGVVWAVCWYIWFRDDPADHKSISKEELKIIVDGRHSNVVSAENTPENELTLRSGNMWLLMVQYFASNFTNFFALTWLFPYLKKTYGLDAVTTGMLAAAPLIAGALANWVSGAVVDYLYRRGWGIWSRRVPAMTGFILSAIGMFGCMNADSATTSVIWLCLAVFGADLTVPASWAYCIDIAGKKSGLVSGKMNMAGNLGSFVTSLAFPYLMAAFSSSAPFFIAAMVFSLVAAVCWFCMNAGKRGTHKA